MRGNKIELRKTSDRIRLSEGSIDTDMHKHVQSVANKIII